MSYKTALITGAGGGIGRATTITLAQMGMRVALLGRNREKLEAVRDELGADGQTALVAVCDVTDRAQTRTTVESLLEEMGSIDVLICNAGTNIRDRSFRSLQPEDWDRVIATNLTGAYNLIHFVLPSMRTRGTGLVVQIDSVAGMRASTVAGVAYSASKFGQAALGICLAREERGRGIRSTVIYAGEVNTAFLDIRGGAFSGTDGGRRQSILQPEDVAAAVRFVAELPPHAHVPELVIKPTIDDFS